MAPRNAGKYRLLARDDGWKPRKAPRISEALARKYCRAEGLYASEIWAGNSRRGRSAAIHRAARERLRPITPRIPTPMRVRVDSLLADAAYRWALSTCRSPDSWTKYLDVLARWIAFRPRGRRQRLGLHQQLQTVAADVLDWLHHLEDEADLARRTVVLHRDVLRSWFRWLWDRGLIDRLPFPREAIRGWRVQHDQVTRGDGTRQALTQEQAQRLAEWALTTAPPVVGFSVLLECSPGLRSIEVERLDRRQITVNDQEQRLVVIGKGGKQRVVPLEPVVVAAWKRYERAARLRGARGPLLRKRGGGRFRRRTIQAWAKRALAIAGRPELSSHDLRRTSATLLIENGADLPQVRALFAHASIETTRRCYVARLRPMTATTGMKVPA